MADQPTVPDFDEALKRAKAKKAAAPDFDATLAAAKAKRDRADQPGAALGVSKSHEAALDTEGLAQAAQTRDEARADVLVREGMRRDEALERARAEYVGSNLKAPGRTTPEAYVATQAGREGDNSPGDVARRAAAPITRRLDQPLPTGGKQEDEWRDLVMQNYAALASPGEWEVVMDRMMKHPEGSDAEAAKAAGIDKSWVQDIKDGMWDVASAIAAPASRGFTSMSEEDDAKAAAGVQKVWNGIKGAAFDKDVIKVTDVMTPASQNGSILAPDVDGIAPSGPRALLQRAAIKVAPIETYSMLAAALGGDYGAAYRTTQFIRDARPDETFDAFSKLVRQAGDDPDAQNDVIRRLDELAPNDIPDRDVGGSYDPATWSVLLRTNPEARANPAFARVFTALDGNQSPERIEAELREVPFGQLATVKPSVGPTLGAIRELGARRAKALKATGGDTSAALERLAGSALVERVVEEGKPRYVENRAGQVLRLAGVLAEGVYETDLKVTDLPGPYVYTGIIAAADAAGAEDFARALQEMPLPTKASLDRALATGAYDSWREEFGMAGAYRPLRDDPGGWKGWVARVAANTQMPEFAGPGYKATYERAGGDVTSPVGGALGFVDFTVDMLNPVDDFALHGVTTVAGRSARAASAARLAPSGAKLEAATAAAIPEVMASGVDRDAITAVNQAIERAVIKAHDEGDFVQLPELFDREVDAVLGQATSENVKGAVRKAAERRRARVITAKQKMLDRGGTPEQLALRGTPAYQRRVAEYDALVQDGKITPDQKSVGLAMDEVRAFILSDEGKVGTPEEYFGRVKREIGGTSGPGAYFQGGAKPRTATLFSGGGLVEEGLRGVVDPVYAVEANADIGAHYARVHGDHITVGDVRTVEMPKEGEVDYLHASPVCKNASVANLTTDGEQALDIETAQATAKAIRQAKPPIFTLENVAGYGKTEAMKVIEDALREEGYTFDARVYDAADYGAATSRKRLLLRAVKDGNLPPVPTGRAGALFGAPRADWFATVEDIVENLPDDTAPPWMVQRLRASGVDAAAPSKPIIVMGGSVSSTNVPFAFAGGPAPTIKATPNEAHRIILPDGRVKRVTPRAMARITGLPDTYELPANRALATTIIGNGVPPALTKAVFGPLFERSFNSTIGGKATGQGTIERVDRRGLSVVQGGNAPRDPNYIAPVDERGWYVFGDSSQVQQISDARAAIARKMDELRAERDSLMRTPDGARIPLSERSAKSIMRIEGIRDEVNALLAQDEALRVQFVEANRRAGIAEVPGVGATKLYQQTPDGIRGSIEPAIKNQQAIGYIQRFFNGADFDTLLHEDAHLLRFMFGDDWTNDLARHFDHVVDPTTGRVSLTRKGEEQTAEALRYYFRTKMQPDGYVRGLLDRVYVMKQNLWLPLRGEAKLLPTELSAMWDASLRPSDTLNAPAVKIADMEALRKIPNVTTVDDPAQAVAANVEPRSGKLREFARIDAVPAESRAALGIDASTVEMDPLQLYARAVAHVVTEKYRATGWGNEALVRLGTRGRVAVPKSRAERVIADVAARTRAILGNDAPVIVGERMQFTPAQAAGVKSIVNEIVHSPLGDGLSAEARTFDAHAPNASLSVNAWNDLHDRLIDIHAGVGAARRRGAEEIATAPLFAAIWRTLANPMIEQVLDRKEGMRHLDNVIEMFRVDDEMAKYMHPQAREAIDEGVRALGHISEEVISDVRALSRGERADRTAAMRRLVFDHSRPVVQVGDAGRIVDATTWFGDVNGTWTGAARIGGAGHGPLPTLDGLFDNRAAKLNEFEGLMARNPIAGEATLLPREQVAFTELRRLDVQRVQAGQTWADVLANPMDEAMLGDSLAIVQHGINVRQSMLLRQADELVVRLAGSNDRSVLTKLAPTERIAVYNDFWTGAWDSMFDRIKSLGQEVIGPSYDQQAAILSVVTGLRADTMINRLGERLLDLGVGLDLDRATTLGMGPASSYANEIGQRGPDGFNATRSRVLGWINRIVTWKEAGITRLEPVTMPDGSIQMKPTRWQDPAGEFMNRVDMESPEQREAYTLANRYLSILGWKHGKGSFGDMAVVFPDGREMFIPEFVWGEIQATVERTAKTGVAFADAKARGLGGAFHELAGAIARRADEPAAYLGLAEADNTASRMTPLMPQEEAVRAKRRAATWTGTVGGATVGGALAGPPGAIAGALIGRNVVPTAIDVAGNLARRGAKDAGVVGAVVGGASGAAIGAALGAVKTAVDGLRVAVPMTLALGRVGMTAGLVIAHPAFFVGNVFGALFQTYMRTGAKGVAGAFGALMSNPQTASYLLASMADGWGDRAMRVLPTPRPLVTRTGAVWTPEMLVDACKRYGLDSSYVKAESTGALVDAIKNITGKWTDKLLDAPIQTGMTPVREWQALIMESATAIDNANRIGVFLDNLQRGVEPHMAASIARDAAFDYGKLTDVERTVMRNTVLFYSYMRQSVDLFWWSLLNNPSRVIGILRATNGQRYDDIEAPDVVVPESMDSRLILSYREAIRDGHAVQGVATVSPRIPLDMIPLWSDMVGAWQGDQDSALNLAGRLTPPVQWALNKTFGVDTFSGMPLNDYNEVPEWWVETMRNTTGSLMDDLLGIEPLERRDPKSEPYRDAPRYQARNGQMWWVLRTAIQTPMFGRSISTLTAADRAGIGGGAGSVQQIVDWSRDYRSSGGNASWDAFFNGPARDIARSLLLTEESRGLLAEPRTFPVGTRPDVTPARPWTVDDEEDWALLGMPSMQVDTYDVARNNAAADILRDVNEQVKKEQAAREGRYGR